MRESFVACDMHPQIRLTRREVLEALNSVGCVHQSTEDNAFVAHFNNLLVKFNFAALGDPEMITPEQWEWCNDPPTELLTLH
jgi:hypothetical protein